MDDKDRMRMMHDIAPDQWDKSPMSLAHEIKGFLENICGADTSIDSGGGDGAGDLWVTIGGIEYFVSIRRSNNQLLKDGYTTAP